MFSYVSNATSDGERGERRSPSLLQSPSKFHGGAEATLLNGGDPQILGRENLIFPFFLMGQCMKMQFPGSVFRRFVFVLCISCCFPVLQCSCCSLFMCFPGCSALVFLLFCFCFRSAASVFLFICSFVTSQIRDATFNMLQTLCKQQRKSRVKHMRREAKSNIAQQIPEKNEASNSTYAFVFFGGEVLRHASPTAPFLRLPKKMVNMAKPPVEHILCTWLCFLANLKLKNCKSCYAVSNKPKTE